MAVDQGGDPREEVFALADGPFKRVHTASEERTAEARQRAPYWRLNGRPGQAEPGDLAGAAADAAHHPEGFVGTTEYSTANPRPGRNRIFNLRRKRYMSVDHPPICGSHRGGRADIQVEVASRGWQGHANATIHGFQEKYPPVASHTSPMGSWAEAPVLSWRRPTRRRRGGHHPPPDGPRGCPRSPSVDRACRRWVLRSGGARSSPRGHRLNDMIRYNPAVRRANNKDSRNGPHHWHAAPRPWSGIRTRTWSPDE